MKKLLTMLSAKEKTKEQLKREVRQVFKQKGLLTESGKLDAKEKREHNLLKSSDKLSKDLKEWYRFRNMTGKDGVTAFQLGGCPPSKRK